MPYTPQTYDPQEIDKIYNDLNAFKRRREEEDYNDKKARRLTLAAIIFLAGLGGLGTYVWARQNIPENERQAQVEMEERRPLLKRKAREVDRYVILAESSLEENNADAAKEYLLAGQRAAAEYENACPKSDTATSRGCALNATWLRVPVDYHMYKLGMPVEQKPE